jgi:hypothetical protein
MIFIYADVDRNQTETHLILDSDLYADRIWDFQVGLSYDACLYACLWPWLPDCYSEYRPSPQYHLQTTYGGRVLFTHPPHPCQSPTSLSSSTPSSTNVSPMPLTLTPTLGTPNPTPENGVYFFADRRQDAEHRSSVATAAAA